MEGQHPVREQFQAKVTSWAARDVAIRSSRLRLACMPAPASNAVLGLRRTWPRPTLPRVTFTWPEIAAFGVRPDRAADRRGRLVGAMIVGPRAGESLAELVLAARHGLRARGLGAAMHAYPTDSGGVWKAAIAEVQHELNRPAVAAGPGC